MTTSNPANFSKPSESAARLSWQGLRLDVPEKWNPLKLDGDDAKGSMVLADLHRPRLAVRWSVLPDKTDPEKWSSRVMTEEVGTLAANEAVTQDAGPEWTASRLYVEPDPPGRDVWIGMHRATRRGVQIVYQAKRRDRVLVDTILPGLSDAGRDANRPAEWSVFELNFTLPRWIKLSGQTLNAGDLALTFTDPRGKLQKPGVTITVRQIAVAQLALKRFSLEHWLGRSQFAERARFKPAGELSKIELTTTDGRSLVGWSGKMARRRRYAWMRWELPEQTTLALHDAARDRLIIVQGSESDMLREVARTVGVLRAKD